ncbi:hypothetical protein [Chryseolinea sp. H1M3-3]|uniref:DUF6958 family protein n=1 Tax=Chryseolinea sp. H1M3-3 TaxID=3034144 RepID=UPI0023EB7B05|nr:hypothetical protein [Chryseolinea sp. H1M3-3]
MKTILLVDALGKRTLSLSTPVYESIKEFILNVVKEKGEILFTELLDLAEQNKTLLYEGDMSWCFLVVKRDLEARGIIKVKVGLGPHREQLLSLNKKKRTAARSSYF